MQFSNIKHLLLILLTFISLSVSGTNKDTNSSKGVAITYEAGYRYSIDSKVLGETRELLIHLPKDYHNSDKKYPVIYLLDGDGNFRHATSAINSLTSEDHMPEAILVGITNKKGMRTRDLHDQRDQFWSYIKTEVIDFVESNFRVSQHRTLFGHSFGGDFVMQGFIENNTWFDSFIAASPAMEESIVKQYKELEVVK